MRSAVVLKTWGWVAFGLGLLALSGCSLFRTDPLAQHRGALVLVFDTRSCGDLKSLRRILTACDVRATVFAAGPIDRGRALALQDLNDEGCEIGLSGLRGLDPQSYGRSYGPQKYFQDEIVTQVLDARRQGLNPRYFLLPPLVQAKSDTLALPSFLISKGFARIVHKMPSTLVPRAKPASELTGSLLHTYELRKDNFDPAQIAALAKRDEILIVSPARQVLPDLISEAQAQGIPFATVADLKAETPKALPLQ